MTEPSPISATFADFKIVKTRGTAQLIFELPLESADDALKALGGLPQMKSERWCGIVPLNLRPLPAVLTEAPPTVPDEPRPMKQRARFDTLPLPQQAVLLCDAPAFWRFLNETQGLIVEVASVDQAADAIRSMFVLSSRAELATDKEAGANFRRLVNEYEVWKLTPSLSKQPETV